MTFSIARALLFCSTTLTFGCHATKGDAERDRQAAVAAAVDSVTREWKHEAGVDSVQSRGDTNTVWVSPRNWKATDAPHAGVRVVPRGRIVSVHWIMGG